MTQQQAKPSFSPEQEITSKDGVEQALEYLIDKHDLDLDLDIEISAKMTRSAGIYYGNDDIIRISKHLLKNYPENVFETVRHELGHALAHKNHGRHIDPHGKEWKQAMAELGIEDPDRCHEMKLTKDKYIVTCSNPDCDSEWRRKKKCKLVKRAEDYNCKKCGSSLESSEIEETDEQNSEVATYERDFKEVEMDKIELKDSLRKEYDEEEIQRKKKSIKRDGLIQPIELSETDDGYEIVSGAYRFFAFEELGRDTIPAFVVEDMDEIDRKTRGLAENLIRKDMKPSEKIIRTGEILNHFKNNMENDSPGEVGANQKFAERFGVSPATVSKWKVIHDYWRPEEEMEAKRLDEGKLSMSNLHEICKERKRQENSDEDDEEDETIWDDEDDRDEESEDDGDDENDGDEGSQVFRKLKKWVSPPTDDVDKLSESKLTELRKDMDKQVLPIYKETLIRSKTTEEEVEQIRQQIGEIQDELDSKV